MTMVEPRVSGPEDNGEATPPRSRREWPAIVVTLVLVALAALALGQTGSKSLYVLVGVAGVVIVMWSIRDLIGPPVAEAVRRVGPRPVEARPFGPVRTAIGAVAAALGAGVLAFVLADAGTKFLYAVAGLVIAGVGVWLLWPALLLLVDTPPAPDRPLDRRNLIDPEADPDDPDLEPDVEPTVDARDARRADWERMGLGRQDVTGPGVGRSGRAFGMFLTVMAAGILAFMAAEMGSKALLALVGGVVVVACLWRAKDRSLFLVFGLMCSLAFLLHKSFSPQDLTLSGGAPSVYVTSFDALLLLLYGVWITEGTFRSDVRNAVSRRILWVPLIGALFLLPSLLSGGSSGWHSASELARMAFMYLLFFYVAVRVRSRAMVWAILGGFAAFATVEFVVIILQWKTGGVLGLSFLGVPTHLTARTTDTSIIGRPFGTIIHPVFMGAAMGSLGLLSFAFGLTLRRSLTKVAALALTSACVLCLYLSHTRASLVAFTIVLLGMVVVALAHRQLTWRTVGRVTLVLLIGAAVFFPQLDHAFEANFGTGHFSEEVTSRYQLNDLAGRMIAQHPVIGVGLNNFEVVMGPYEDHGIIFVDNPVHNLYLLYLAETGIVGLTGLLIVGVAMYNVALRLARSRDRLLGGVGLGVSAAMAFLMVEELLGFSLRQDVPLAMYWIFAGLAVACYRMAGLEGWRRPRHQAATPPGGPVARGRIRPGDGPRPDGVWVPAHAGGAGPGNGNGNGNGNGHANRAAIDGGRLGLAQWRHARARRRVARAALARLEEEYAAFEALANFDPASQRAARRRLDEEIAAFEALVRRDPTVVAGAGRAGRPPWRWTARTRSTGGGQLRWGLAMLVVFGLLAGGLGGSTGAQATSVVPLSAMRVVFSARTILKPSDPPGTPVANEIFTANGDGSGLKLLLYSDGHTLYNWPQWALGGTKIIFTARTGPPISKDDLFGSWENIFEMNADGSGKRQLTNYKFRAVQPKVSADGRSVVFTAQNPQYPLDAIYKLDLLTLQATNLSQTTQPDGSVDADPKWTPDGNVVITSTEANQTGTAIDQLSADGSTRTVLVNDGHFNTDPEVSPDGSQMTYSAYVGDDPVVNPSKIDPLDPDGVQLQPADWIIEVRNQATGALTPLNKGLACVSATTTCAPGDSSGWKPVWSPDGKTVAYTGRLNQTTSCVCAVNADGSDPRVLIKSDHLVIKWFDWTTPGGKAPSSAVTDAQVGSQAVSSRLLISSSGTKAGPSILDEPVDMMGDDDAGTGTTSHPSSGAWDAARTEFAFVGNATYDVNHPQYGPPPPPGQQVHEHFTLQEVDPALNPRYPVTATSAQQQIFLHRADGSVVQLTTPWTEDWRDAINAGDARSNTDPVLSPDGRYVVFTNHSSLTGESFLLRMDLQTGEVLNLTNGTAGAMQVDDGLAKFSPDSSKIAFTWTEGSDTDVFVMNASDGTAVTHVTDDQAYDMDPTWSPDGHSIVFSRHDGALAPTEAQVDSLLTLPRTGWSLVKVDVASGHTQTLTSSADSPAWRPVYSPDGQHIDFIGWQHKTTDIFQTTPDGGPVTPLLITPLINETSVDWK